MLAICLKIKKKITENHREDGDSDAITFKNDYSFIGKFTF